MTPSFSVTDTLPDQRRGAAETNPSVSAARRPTVTVVIPAHNEEATIAETIQSIQRQSRPPDRILVVDDASTDGTGAIARALGAKVVRPHRNQGTKAQAQNIALPFLDTDITVTIDADTTLAFHALERLVDPFERDLTLTLASGYLVPRHLGTLWERGRLVEYVYSFELYKMAQSAVGAPVVCSGAFSAFRTSVLKAHHGFDPGTMAEDLNFTWKVHITGGRAAFIEDAICYPVDPPTWPVYFRQVDRWIRAFFQNLMIYWKTLHRRPMLAVFVWTGVAEAFLFPLSVLAMVYLAFAAAVGRTEIHWMWWLSSIVGVDVVLVSAFSIRGGIRVGRLSAVLRSLPAYYLLKLVNVGLWWRGFYLEVVRRRRLVEWEKGH